MDLKKYKHTVTHRWSKRTIFARFLRRRTRIEAPSRDSSEGGVWWWVVPEWVGCGK
jgi:hypothetical protein